MKHAEVQNVYAPPLADLKTDQSHGLHFFPTSIKKLIILFLATFSLYTLYWFYKQWNHQKPLMEKKINPVLRSIFSLFFTHSLFNRVKENAEQEGIEPGINYSMLATLFVVLQILSSILDNIPQEFLNIPLTLAGIATILAMLYPLVTVQQQINLINDDPEGTANSKFSIYNYVFIVLGVLFWALVGVGLFMPMY